MTPDKYYSPEYKLSRKAYCAQCAFEYLISILVCDAYLAKLLSSIGLSDTLIGIISSFITLAFLFQLASIFLVHRIKNVKRTVIIFSIASQLLFTSLYLIPFIPASREIRTVLVTVGILVAYLGTYLINSVAFKWANSFVDPAKRGDYSAVKEMISLIAGMLFTFAVGYVIDITEAAGKLYSGFLFIAAAGLILSVCDFISLMLISNAKTIGAKKTQPVGEVLSKLIHNRNFIRIVIFTVLWNVAQYFTVGFLGIYKTKDLMFTVGTVQLINIVGNMFRFFISRPFGRFSDRHSYSRGMELALCITAVAFAFNIFTMPQTRWFIVVYTVLFSVSIAGIGQNSYNILYSYVPEEYFVEASAIKNSIGGICGFGASLLGGMILDKVQSGGNMVFGIHIYGQQILSAISFLLIITALLYLHFAVSRQSGIKQ